MYGEGRIGMMGNNAGPWFVRVIRSCVGAVALRWLAAAWRAGRAGQGVAGFHTFMLSCFSATCTRTVFSHEISDV